MPNNNILQDLESIKSDIKKNEDELQELEDFEKDAEEKLNDPLLDPGTELFELQDNSKKLRDKIKKLVEGNDEK